MKRRPDPVADLDGAAAPPRKNGELVFDAPWESRAFGMAVALHGEGTFAWDEFSQRLAAEIAEQGGSMTEQVLPVAPDAEESYYARWLASLEALLIEKGVISRDELEVRTGEFAAGMWDEH